MEDITFTMYPFYGTQRPSETVINIGPLPIGCAITGKRSEMLESISYFVSSLNKLITVHSDYELPIETYYKHIATSINSYISHFDIPELEYRSIFYDLHNTTSYINAIYQKYGMPHEGPDVKEHITNMESVLQKPKSNLSDADIELFFKSYCSFVLTFTTSFFLIKVLPVLELMSFFKSYSSIETVELETESVETLNKYATDTDPIKLKYDFQDLSINIMFTTFKRYLINSDWIFIRYYTSLFMDKAGQMIATKKNEEIDWSAQTSKLIKYLMRRVPNLRKYRLNLLTVKSSPATLANLIHKLSTDTVQSEIIDLIDAHNPMWSGDWRLMQYPYVVLIHKSRLSCLIEHYIYMVDKIINGLVKDKRYNYLFADEPNLTDRAGVTLRNIIERIFDKSIITAENWDIFTKDDTQFLVKLLTALLKENVNFKPEIESTYSYGK